jgi:hypothetical protein
LQDNHKELGVTVDRMPFPAPVVDYTNSSEFVLSRIRLDDSQAGQEPATTTALVSPQYIRINAVTKIAALNLSTAEFGSATLVFSIYPVFPLRDTGGSEPQGTTMRRLLQAQDPEICVWDVYITPEGQEIYYLYPLAQYNAGTHVLTMGIREDVVARYSYLDPETQHRKLKVGAMQSCYPESAINYRDASAPLVRSIRGWGWYLCLMVPWVLLTWASVLVFVQYLYHA